MRSADEDEMGCDCCTEGDSEAPPSTDDDIDDSSSNKLNENEVSRGWVYCKREARAFARRISPTNRAPNHPH